jgi:hypothetical protein
MPLKSKIAHWLLSSKEHNGSKKQFLNWNQLKNVCLIVYDNQLSNIVDFINTCKKDNIDVNVIIIYEGKPELAPKPNFNHIILDKKHFSLFGIPNETTEKKVNGNSIDALINICKPNHIKAIALTKLISARCKIGNFQSDFFDIIIDGEQTKNEFQFLEQVIVYLHMIKNNL